MIGPLPFWVWLIGYFAVAVAFYIGIMRHEWKDFTDELGQPTTAAREINEQGEKYDRYTRDMVYHREIKTIQVEKPQKSDYQDAIFASIFWPLTAIGSAIYLLFKAVEWAATPKVHKSKDRRDKLSAELQSLEEDNLDND